MWSRMNVIYTKMLLNMEKTFFMILYPMEIRITLILNILEFIQ